MDRLKRQKYRIKASIDRGKEINDTLYKHAYDDVLVQELRLIKNQAYSFRFRSKDVLHCPWIPHMRMQINAVPGMETRFDMTPTITTEEMREKPEVIEHYNNISKIHHQRLINIGEKSKSNIIEPIKFNYILMCNKICGAQHSNMKMDVVVETKEEFGAWFSEQKTVLDKLAKE
jgi:cytochrome c oxidase subunit 2